VTIPAGIDNGQVISLRNEGEAGSKGGDPGDLKIVIYVKPHKYFKRDGYDLFLNMPIDFVDATLGAELQIPTLDGKVKYKLPESTQTGTTFRLKKKGIQHINSSLIGDLYVKVNIETPKRLSEKQKELLRTFKEQNKDGGKTFFEQVRDSIKR